MKNSFFEDFLAHLGKSKQKNRILATVALSLAVVVFLGAYMLVSQNAMAEETGDMDKLEKSFDIVTLQADDDDLANNPYKNGLDTNQVVGFVEPSDTLLVGEPELAVQENLGDIQEQGKTSGDVSDEDTNTLPEEEEVAYDPYELTKKKNIDGITVRWYDGEKFVDLTTDREVKDGDRIEITVAYRLADKELENGQNVITYTLPVGVKFDANLDGDVLIEGAIVGSYIIDKETRLITITFDEEDSDDFEYTDAMTGTITFRGRIDGTVAGEDGTIQFGDQCTITMEQPKEPTISYGITATKSDGNLTAEGKVPYTITVTAANGGTTQDITITDILKSSAGYVDGDYENIVVTKAGKEITPTKSTIKNEENPSMFKMTLPALDKGEKYIIKYTVDPGDNQPDTFRADGATYMGNNVTVVSDNTVNKTTDTELKKKTIEKTNLDTGYPKGDKDRIDWKITLRPGPGGLAGWTLTDVMTGLGADSVKVTNVKLDGVEINISQPFDANYSQDKEYIITYSTDVSDLPVNVNTNVKNKATLQKDGEGKYDASKTIGVFKKTYTVKKEYVSNEKDAETPIVTYNWKSIIPIPKEGDVNGSISYTDILGDVAGSAHYTTVGSLFAPKMIVTVSEDDEISEDDTSVTEGYSVTQYYSMSKDWFGNVYSKNEAIKAKGFTLNFTQDFLQKNAEKNIIIQYVSYLDTDKLTPGESYTVKNTANIGTGNVTVSAPYDADVKISKLVSQKENGTYRENLSEVAYSDILKDGTPVLYYRITVEPSRYDGNFPTLVDTLPTGASLLGDPVVKFKSTANNKLSDWIGRNKATECITRPSDAEDGTVTFEFTEAGKKINWQNCDLQIQYKIALPTPESWEGNGAEQTFTNTLSDGTDDVSSTVNVVNTDSYLTKVGIQETTGSGENQKFTTKANYTLKINQSRSDLSGDDTVELVDTMDTGNQYITATLDRDSVKLYDADGVDVSNKISALTTEGQGTDEPIITLEVPDGESFVLKYTYIIYNNTDGVAQLSNSAVLEGMKKTEAGSGFKFVDVESSSNVVQEKATILKHALNNELLELEGAVFKSEEYGTDGQWTMKDNDIKKDENGKMSLSFAGAGAYKKDTLYRLIETIAPDGYVKDTTPKYFVWLDKKTVDTIAIPENEGIVKADIIQLTPTNLEIKFPNTPDESITVTKQWLAPNGDSMETPPQETLSVTLYQYVGTSVKASQEITLTADEEWSKEYSLVAYQGAWGTEDDAYADDELPMYDEDGNHYSYAVLESNIPEGYMAEFWIQTGGTSEETTGSTPIPNGTLLIQNTQIAYTLPETGGLGTAVPLVAGLLIITLATTLIIYRKKRTT